MDTRQSDYYNIASYLTKYPSNSIRVDRKKFFFDAVKLRPSQIEQKSLSILGRTINLCFWMEEVENRMKIFGVVNPFLRKPIIYYDILKMPRSKKYRCFIVKDGKQDLCFQRK